MIELKVKETLHSDVTNVTKCVFVIWPNLQFVAAIVCLIIVTYCCHYLRKTVHLCKKPDVYYSFY